MSEPGKDMTIVPVRRDEKLTFREMLVDYWRDLVPDAPFLADPIRAETYFRARYQWTGGSRNPFWGFDRGRRIGFFMYKLSGDSVEAYIHDFYIVLDARRQGRGARMFKILLIHLNDLGVNQINLSVLANNPDALKFWFSLGFQLTSYRLNRLTDSTAE